MKPINSQTVADSIAADLPRDRVKAVRAVRETKGAFVSVPDQAILDGIPVLARLSGVFAEPAAAGGLRGRPQRRWRKGMSGPMSAWCCW